MKHTFFLLTCLLLLTTDAAADRYTFLGSYESHSVSGREVTIIATNNVMRLTLADTGIVRILIGEDGRIEDIPSYAVVYPGNALLSWEIDDTPGALELTMPGGRVSVQKFPLRLRFLDEETTLIAADAPSFGHAWDGKEVHVWKALHENERFYGLGEKTGGLNKRGAQWVMWNSDNPGYRDGEDPLYVSIPFFIGVRDVGAYGIFFDNSYRSVFNMGAASDRVYSFGAEDGEMNYYFMFGPSIDDVVRRYTRLTGRMPLPPMWSLGYQQCRWSYYPAFEVLDVARNFRQRKIPADVIYLDIRYMDRYKVFTWDSTGFPDPAGLCAELGKMGFKVVPIIDPGVKIEEGYDVYEEGLRSGYFARYPDGDPYQGEVWPGWCHFPDFTRTGTRDWWGIHCGELLDTGVDGFWNDMNEPAVWGREMPLMVEFDDEGRRSTIKKIHNVYGHLMAQATYEGMRGSHPAKRPFIVTRAGFAGTQRYAAIWTGDNNARFDDLRLALRMCVGLGLSGVPFTGPDVGGFIGTPTAELYTRWIQAGVFTPFFRTHTHINTPDQEPWSFGEWTEDIVRNYIGMRYELLPYIYNEMRRASRDGTPFMRPLFYDFHDDPETFSSRWEHQFLAGSQILVAPVVHEGKQLKEVYLPPGRWVDPWNGESHDGGNSIIVKAPLERLPYFYRGGAIVPRREVQQHSGERPLTELILDVVPGDESSYTLYLDAGEGFSHLTGDFDEIRFSMRNDGTTWIIETQSSDGRWARALRSIRFRIIGSGIMPRGIRINDESLLFETDAERERARVMQDENNRRFEISLPFRTGHREYRFEY